nr:serine/threonine-protein kinase [Nannocystis pusilla]
MDVSARARQDAPVSGTPTEIGDTQVPGARGTGDWGDLELRGIRGQVIAGRYELLALLGRGGMGMVFSARDRELDEVVALKMLHPSLSCGTQDRIRREVKLARRITHRNVARTFELGEHQGSRFLTMEFVDGEPLANVLERQPRLPVERAAPIFIAVCDALEAAHEAGVVHRDIKPDNVLVEPRGRVVVTDFGVAAFKDESQDGGGTPAYMAPEQVTGGEVTLQTDLYALGVMMFEVLTGALPWPADSAIASMMRRLDEPPPDVLAAAPGLPPAIAAIVAGCLAREAPARPASARAVAEALRAALLEADIDPALPSSSTLLAIQAPSRRDTPVAGTPARTLAVLPFVAGPEIDGYVADALVEDLIDSLSALKGLRVRARTRVDGERDPQEVGRALAVGFVVDGSLRRLGPRLRLGLRLVDVASGFQTWSERFEVAPEQVLTLAGPATRAIAGALTLDEHGQDREAPTDPAALDLYLRARHHYHLFTPPDTLRAVELFHEAAALDPESPMIASGLSMAAVRLSFVQMDTSSALLTTARAAAERALARAPQLGEPYLALANLSLVTGDQVTAARHARNAIARAPSSADAHELLGRLLLEAGHVEDGERRLRAALELDPRLSVARWELVRLAAFDGDWDRHDRLVADRPDRERRAPWAVLVRFATWRGDPALLARLEAELRDDPDVQFRELYLALLGVYDGRMPLAPVLAAVDLELGRAGHGTRQQQFLLQLMVELAGAVKDDATALNLLDRAAAAGVFDLLWLDRCPLLLHLHQEPGFARVRAQIQSRADAIVDAIWSG